MAEITYGTQDSFCGQRKYLNYQEALPELGPVVRSQSESSQHTTSQQPKPNLVAQQPTGATPPLQREE